MRKKRKQFTIAIFAILVVAVMCIAYKQSIVRLSPGVGFNRNTYTAKDSFMIKDRHMGYVNYDRFVQLVRKKLPKDSLVASVKGDSAYFRTKPIYTHYFYSQNSSWIRQYKNLPIHIRPNGFSAKLETIDSVRYVFLPYQILANLVKSGESPSICDEGADCEPRQTIHDGRDLPTPESVWENLIQTEGLVRRNVVEILSRYPHRSQQEQLEILWRYAKEHWNYMNDPNSTTDTWRPASETINDYYIVNGKCYTGDCDDFAILMASFAQQVGFDSRLVVAYNNKKEGHAYAEYKKGGTWVPMDWFSNKLGGKPFEATKRYVLKEDRWE